MKVSELPPELVSRLDELAGMEHSSHGRVNTALAELLTLYEAMQPPTPAAMVAEWSEATGGDPLSLTEWVRLRVDLMVEEVIEWLDAMAYFAQTGDATKLAKESADVQYILEGTALRPGIDLARAFCIVHVSNMTKIHPDGTYRVREDGKILKPDSYQPPDMAPSIRGIS